MEDYAGHLISVLVMLGGLVGVYVSIQKQLTAIKTRLEMDDKGKTDRDAARRLEMADIARAELRIHKAECPSREPTGVRAMPLE